VSVFIVHPLNDKNTDISAALEYGEPVYVNSRYVFPDELEGEELPHALYNKMLRAVDKFDIEADYLLIAGDHLQLVAMSALLAERWGAFRVLRFDRQAEGYVIVNIEARINVSSP
jgi:hypothetical protein